jgi:hypothetical protein
VWGQRKISQVLGAFRLLDSTFYGPFSLGEPFETYEPFISLIFQFCRAAVNRGYLIGGYGGTPVGGTYVFFNIAYISIFQLIFFVSASVYINL